MDQSHLHMPQNMCDRFFLALAMVSACAGATAAGVRTNNASATVRSAPWRQYASPSAAGFDAGRLELARRYADSVQSGSVMVVHRGNVVAAWGDVSRKLELHSVRKSIVSSLFGIAAARGEVDLDRTLGDIGFSDRQPLTPTEQHATVRDLLSARSGVYLPAAYADASQDAERPLRGSHAPGTFWFYNNWDFNALGVIYEQLVDASLYRSLDQRIAKPIGMEDYAESDGFLVYEPTYSNHPAHTIRMSARDLARFGELYRRGGVWEGIQVVPRTWVSESTRPISILAPDRGYAYLWWTREPVVAADAYPEVNKRAMYYGSGTGGQLVLVIPSDELVIVHRGDTDHGRKISGRDAWHIVELVLEAKTGSAASTTTTIPLSPVPFASQLPAVALVPYVALDDELISQLSGNYVLEPGKIARVFSDKKRLFGNFPGLGEAELLGLTRYTFTIHVESGVEFVFERDATGAVTGFSGHVGRQQLRGRKE